MIETPPPQFRGATRLNSHNWHVGWLPIFISNERSANTSALVQKILNQLTVNGARSFRAVSLGGATDCLWSWEATKINIPTDLPPQAKAFCSAALGQWKRGDSNGKWINKVTELQSEPEEEVWLYEFLEVMRYDSMGVGELDEFYFSFGGKKADLEVLYNEQDLDRAGNYINLIDYEQLDREDLRIGYLKKRNKIRPD